MQEKVKKIKLKKEEKYKNLLEKLDLKIDKESSNTELHNLILQKD